MEQAGFSVWPIRYVGGELARVKAVAAIAVTATAASVIAIAIIAVILKPQLLLLTVAELFESALRSPYQCLRAKSANV